MRPPNRPDFMYEKPGRIEGMCENHRLMGFPTHACRALVLVLSSYAYQEIVSLLLATWQKTARSSRCGKAAWGCVSRDQRSSERERGSGPTAMPGQAGTKCRNTVTGREFLENQP